MAEQDLSAGSEPTAIYEIRLKGAAQQLRDEFPSATVSTTRTETVLFRRVEQPADLDELIDQLLSRGFVLTEVREVESPSPSTLEPDGTSSKEGPNHDDV